MSNFIENTYAQALNAILDFVSGSENIGNQAIEQVIRSAFSVVETSKELSATTESKVLSADRLYQLVNRLQQSWSNQYAIRKPNGVFAASYNEHLAYGIHAAMEAKNE